jgi:hypothetical protein
MPTLADISLADFERENSETGTSQFNNMGYAAALGQAGYVPTAQNYGTYWKSPETLNYFNQTYGTNFSDPMSYMNYLYGSGGSLVNDPTHGQLYKLPDGRSYTDFVNQPLSYDKSDWFDTVIPGIIGGVAIAGMGGMLPGTESIFGGGGLSTAGAYGGEIAGTSAAGEGLAGAASGLGGGGGFSWADPTTWGAADAPWGVNPIGSGVNPGGLDGALGDSVANYTAGMGANNALTGAGGAMFSGGGSMIDSVLNYLKQNPMQALGMGSSLLGGLLQYGAATSAADTQADAANRATAAQMAMFNTINQQQAPWRQAGVGALGSMQEMMPYFTHQFNAQDLNANLAPNYQFMLDQGLGAVRNQANATGGLISGNTLKGINDYAQNYAQNAYQQAFNNYTANQTNIFNRLSNIAGLGQTANANVGQAGTAISGNAAQSMMNAGASQAAGTIGGANALSGALQNALGWYFLPQLMGQGS